MFEKLLTQIKIPLSRFTNKDNKITQKNSTGKKIFQRDLVRRVLFTILMVVIFRFLATVPLPGVDVEVFKQVTGNTPFSNIFTLVSGGSLDQPSLVAIGVAPYINASIIIQLLTTVIPHLEELRKQGETGRQKISQYTRFLTFPLAVMQSIMIYFILTNPTLGGQVATGLIRDLSVFEIVIFVTSLTAGSMFLMWIGELITEFGIGNGASLIIAIGIMATIPGLIVSQIGGINTDLSLVLDGNLTVLFSSANLQLFYLVIALVIAMVIFITFINESERKVPIRYAKRGNSIGTEKNYLPLKLNQSGVMPIIFAQALISFPQIISSFLVSVTQPDSTVYNIANDALNMDVFNFNTPEYLILYAILIVLFAFFYTFVVIKPEELAKNLQRAGAYVPGIRPGNSTISYINGLTTKLTIFGAMFLVIITLLPSVLSLFDYTNGLTILTGIGGSSLLIVVGVFMDMHRKAQSLQSIQNYEIYS